MQSKDKDLLQKAKDYAFLLFKFRPRSEKELCQRLKNKKFDDRTIRDTLAFLKDKAFLDDFSFARAWIESRLKKPFGLRRIRQELKLKGIDEEIISSRIAAAKEGYSEEEIVRKIAKEKFNKIRNLETDKAKRRIFSYLIRRGFSSDTVADAVRQL